MLRIVTKKSVRLRTGSSIGEKCSAALHPIFKLKGCGRIGKAEQINGYLSAER